MSCFAFLLKTSILQQCVQLIIHKLSKMKKISTLKKVKTKDRRFISKYLKKSLLKTQKSLKKRIGKQKRITLWLIWGKKLLIGCKSQSRSQRQILKSAKEDMLGSWRTRENGPSLSIRSSKMGIRMKDKIGLKFKKFFQRTLLIKVCFLALKK